MQEADQKEQRATQWHIVPVDWKSELATLAREIRIKVFVEEQGFPAEDEFDAFDPTAHHIVAFDAAGAACGTARLCPDLLGPDAARIGRVAVMPRARGKGCGKAMIEHLINVARERGYRGVVLAAQEQSIGFYLRLVFTPYGPHFLDAHVPHQEMVLYLQHSDCLDRASCPRF
jgi:predicted GNAT family N-acyltransferase